MKSYNPKEESKHIIYLDANNLYGYVMPEFLPTGEFKWIDYKDFDLNKYKKNNSNGCIAVLINIVFFACENQVDNLPLVF